MDDPDAFDDDLDLELPELRLRDSDLERDVDLDEDLDVALERLLDDPLVPRLELRLLLSFLVATLAGAATSFGGFSNCSSVIGGFSSHFFSVLASGVIV